MNTTLIVTRDILYLRLVGDRSIDERDFGEIQKERTKVPVIVYFFSVVCGDITVIVYLNMKSPVSLTTLV